MPHRRPADGARLVGWEAVRARDAARTLHRPLPTRTDGDLARYLRAAHARLAPPTADTGWHVIRDGRVLGTAHSARTAILRAMRAYPLATLTRQA